MRRGKSAGETPADGGMGEAGFVPVRTEQVGLPLDVLASGKQSAFRRLVSQVDRLLVEVWPTMFAYQFVVIASPQRGGEVVESVGRREAQAPAPS